MSSLVYINASPPTYPLQTPPPQFRQTQSFQQPYPHPCLPISAPPAPLPQRQVVDKRVWRELVAFFPAAVAFRAEESSECMACRGETADERRAEEAVKREREQEIALPVLRALYGRKTGVSSVSCGLSCILVSRFVGCWYGVCESSACSRTPVLLMDREELSGSPGLCAGVAVGFLSRLCRRLVRLVVAPYKRAFKICLDFLFCFGTGRGFGRGGRQQSSPPSRRAMCEHGQLSTPKWHSSGCKNDPVWLAPGGGLSASRTD